MCFKMKKAKKPIPGKDAQWIENCNHCDDMTLWVTRGGFRPGGIQHCYSCGNEKIIAGFGEEDIRRLIISSYCHWKKYPIYPYKKAVNEKI